MKRPSVTSPVGTNVRALRRAAGMTQEQLAETVNAAPETISRIETGRFVPAHALLTRLAEALSAPAALLLTEEPPPLKPRAGLKPAEARLLAAVRHLGDSDLDALTRAIKIMLELPRGG